MKKSNQVDLANIRSAADTLEGMPEEELQEGLKGLEEWDTHFNTSKHYAPRFSPKIGATEIRVFRGVLLTSVILTAMYCIKLLF